MAQRDVPVQRGETATTAGLRVVVSLAGGVVLFTTNGGHAPGSYHYVGQAADVALPEGASWNAPALGDLAERLLKLIPIHMIEEMIWAGPKPVFIKHGRRVAPFAASAHHNHIHLAVVSTFRFNAPPKEAAVPDGPPNYDCFADVVNLVPTNSGQGYWLVCADGSVYGFGDAPYFGRVTVKK